MTERSPVYRQSMEITEDDLPILGEPLPVELANTLYVGTEGTFDVLAEVTTARLWLGASPLADPAGSPLGGAGLARLRSLRDAVRAVLLAHLEGVAPAPSAVPRLNAALELTAGAPRLEASAEGRLQVLARAPRGAVARLEAAIATATLAFVAEGGLAALRRCPGPDCPMLFVAQHHRRKFCHPSCSHRARQAAYYRRRRAAP